MTQCFTISGFVSLFLLVFFFFKFSFPLESPVLSCFHLLIGSVTESLGQLNFFILCFAVAPFFYFSHLSG